METMCAMLLMGHGGTEKLVYRQDVPTPRAGAGEVLIEVSACGVNNTDIWVREGAYGDGRDPAAVSTFQRGESSLVFPRVQGADIVGRIAAVGGGVDARRVGERVMVDFNIYPGSGGPQPDMDYIGHGRDGGFAEYTVVPADQARVIETSMSDVELATFCCAYVTGESMLRRAGVAEGERVLVTGASGGVGSGVVQLCRARGAVPYAVTQAARSAAVIHIGAEAAIPRDAGNLTEAVDIALEGQAVDVVVDTVAGPMFDELIQVLRPEGRYVTCGAMAGSLVKMDLKTLYLKRLQILGSSQGSREDFERVVSYIEQGRLKALVGGVYRLSELHEAQRAFKAKAYVGNLVVVPDARWTAYASGAA